MSITLELMPLEEKLLHDAATRRGLHPIEFVKETILLSIATVGEHTKVDVQTEWDYWAEAGHAATDAARDDLRAHNIPSVYMRDCVIVEELPEGTIQPLPSRKK